MSRVPGDNTEPQRLITPVLCEVMQVRPLLHVGKPLHIIIAVCTLSAMCVGAKGCDCSVFLRNSADFANLTEEKEMFACLQTVEQAIWLGAQTLHA